MKRVHLYGDSITQGATKLPDGTYMVSPYCPFLMATLMFQGRATISNYAVAGTTLEDWYAGNSQMPSLEDRLTMDTPDIVIVELGVNDSTRANFSLDTFKWYLNATRLAMIAHGVKLIMATPNPIDYPNWVILQDIQKAIREFCQTYSIPLIDYYKVIWDNVPNWRELLSDRSHPGNSLYLLKSGLAVSILEKYI